MTSQNSLSSRPISLTKAAITSGVELHSKILKDRLPLSAKSQQASFSEYFTGAPKPLARRIWWTRATARFAKQPAQRRGCSDGSAHDGCGAAERRVRHSGWGTRLAPAAQAQRQWRVRFFRTWCDGELRRTPLTWQRRLHRLSGLALSLFRPGGTG